MQIIPASLLGRCYKKSFRLFICICTRHTREGALVIRFLDCYMVDASVHELPNYLVSETHTILWCFTFLHCREPTLDPVASLVIVCINAVSLPPALAIPTPVLQMTNCALMRKHFSLEPSSLVNTDVVFTEFEYQIPFMK